MTEKEAMFWPKLPGTPLTERTRSRAESKPKSKIPHVDAILQESISPCYEYIYNTPPIVYEDYTVYLSDTNLEFASTVNFTRFLIN